MAAIRNVSRTPLIWRTKTTSTKTPTAIKMYWRYVETTSFLAGTGASSISGAYDPNIPAGGKFTVQIPLCIIVPHMRGGNAQKARYIGRREVSPPSRENHRSAAASRRAGSRPAHDLAERREARKANRTSVYRRRRIMAVGLVLSFTLALVFAVLVQTPTP